MPALPMKDTVYLCDTSKTISSLINREKIYAGQAPEFFVFSKYMEANKALLPNKILGITGSTEPAIMTGLNIAVVSGDEENFKITTETDLRRFQELVKENVV